MVSPNSTSSRTRRVAPFRSPLRTQRLRADGWWRSPRSTAPRCECGAVVAAWTGWSKSPPRRALFISSPCVLGVEFHFNCDFRDASSVSPEHGRAACGHVECFLEQLGKSGIDAAVCDGVLYLCEPMRRRSSLTGRPWRTGRAMTNTLSHGCALSPSGTSMTRLPGMTTIGELAAFELVLALGRAARSL